MRRRIKKGEMDLVIPRAPEPMLERLMRHSMPVTECGCWVWVSSMQGIHGQIGMGGRPKRAHRVSWTIHNGPIPRGMHVLHRCNVGACINPDHLYLGTDLENCHDRIAAGTQPIPPRLIGSKHPNAKISEAVARAIREAIGAAGEVAKQFRVHRATVEAIKAGRQWKNA